MKQHLRSQWWCLKTHNHIDSPRLTKQRLGGEDELIHKWASWTYIFASIKPQKVLDQKPLSRKKRRAQGCLNFIVFGITICALLLAYVSTKLDLGLDPDRRSLGAKRLLMTISEDCIIKQENSKILNPDISPTLADIESVREKIDGYRITNDLHSSDLDLSRSCFSAAAIPTADNNNVVRFQIIRNVQTGQLNKVCSIPKKSMSINQEAEFRNDGCNNGSW